MIPVSMTQVNRVACSKNLKVHLDGARVFNAAVALGVPVHEVVAKADSVSVCMSKGLGCPAGNLVAGSKELIAKAVRCRKVLGGTMRQSGVLAATGIVALNTMVERLDEDHKHARMLAQGKRGVPCHLILVTSGSPVAVSSMKSEIVSVDMKRVQSNIVYLNIDSDVMSVPQFCDRMRKVSRVMCESRPCIQSLSREGSDVLPRVSGDGGGEDRTWRRGRRRADEPTGRMGSYGDSCRRFDGRHTTRHQKTPLCHQRTGKEAPINPPAILRPIPVSLLHVLLR